MKASEGRIGRVFILRLEDGDVIPDVVEKFALEKGISVAYASVVGGVSGGQVVVGPRVTDARPPDPMLLPVDGAHEVAGVGILAPGSDGKPHLHMHAALGRSGQAMAGCVRYGVKTWLVAEVVLFEILGADVKRLIDAASGFELLQAF